MEHNLPDDDYMMPTEQQNELGGAAVPNDLTKWFFVMIITAISTVFGILTKLQADTNDNNKETIVYWQKMYNEERNAKETILKQVATGEVCETQANIYRRFVNNLVGKVDENKLKKAMDDAVIEETSN